MVKKGDTLIEVTIAIGIFSMIAIAVASVMSSGTAGSQLALETTLAREEIDAQAEALRFVHSAFISGRSSKANNKSNGDTSNPYQQLWKNITANAIEVEDVNGVTQFMPSTCDELYTKHEPTDEDGDIGDIFSQNAFFLNTKQLSNPSEAYVYANNDDDVSKFAPASTYPRLIFTNASNTDDSDETLIDTTVRDQIYRAEGIYVIAVKDANETKIVQNSAIPGSGDTTPTSAFYDFYIRTCWYGTDATRPSTISTVIRLYNPSINFNDQ
ncbi:hypothetical protein IKF30_01530 [Candidatus Saccharibacteria bacterium]|nr:hypothetical protein [Candidatus Saccharibacteria bacterium]